MKKTDLTKEIMEKVVGYERRKSRAWLFEILLTTILLIGIGGFFFYLTISDLIEQRSFDLLSIFGEEFEIIKDYWKDAISTFIEEIPPGKLILGVIFIVIGIIILIKSRKKI